MKKSLLFVAAVMAAFSASAQTESGFISASASAGTLTSKTELCKSTNVTMKAAWDDTYKETAMAAGTDLVNQVLIDGTAYSMPSGLQGSTNPGENTLLKGGQQSGAVFQFDVAADGILYVFGKLSYNKNYYVWEGDVANGAGLAVAYTFKGAIATSGDVVSYTLPADANGYYAGMGYDNDFNVAVTDGVLTNSNPSYDNGTQYLSAAGYTKDNNTFAGMIPAESWASGNALGVIAFPVYKDVSYFVNACGSKLTSNGFVFIKDAKSIASISFAKEGTDAIAAPVVASSNKVVKTVENGKVVISANGVKYNVAGVRVK